MPERRRGYLALMDDLARWARTLRDPYSDMHNPALATALEQFMARCRAEEAIAGADDEDV